MAEAGVIDGAAQIEVFPSVPGTPQTRPATGWEGEGGGEQRLDEERMARRDDGAAPARRSTASTPAPDSMVQGALAERRLSTGGESLGAERKTPGTGGKSREEKGDGILRRGEAALARTKLPVWDWGNALFDAKHYLVAAHKEYQSGPTQLLVDKKPTLAEFARSIKVVERQIENQLIQDEDRHQQLIEAGEYSTFISSMEHGWRLREEMFGKGAPQVQEHVEELVLMLNNVSMHLVNIMVPDGNDLSANLAYDYLNRALLLTDSSSDTVKDSNAKKRLRAVTFNNMACYFERRNKFLQSLEFLDKALRLELDVELVEDPSATHLNLCRVLSRLKRHDVAFQHACCAIDILQDYLVTLNAEWEQEKARPPTSVPPTPLFDGLSPPPPTTAGAEVPLRKRNRDVPIEDRMKDAISKFASANYNAACALEQLRRFADALEFHRKAAEGARQAFGSEHHLTVPELGFLRRVSRCAWI
jgi:tetratricopeptide (TPR) repeat protein